MATLLAEPKSEFVEPRNIKVATDNGDTVFIVLEEAYEPIPFGDSYGTKVVRVYDKLELAEEFVEKQQEALYNVHKDQEYIGLDYRYEIIEKKVRTCL